MPTTFTANDVRLLGYAKADIKETTAAYDIIDATSTVGLDGITTRFIHLKTRCTLDIARRVSAQWRQRERTYVVKANSLSLQNESLRDVFGRDAPIYTQEDLVWRVLKTSFADYLNELKANVTVAKPFISPKSSIPEIGPHLVDRLLEFLSAQSGSADGGTLKVLSANAGVGKTTLSRKLVHSLVDRIGTAKCIPVYVEAQHWQKLNVASLDGLWDVIDNSLRVFSAHVPMTESLFRHALRQGYFSFIFDGFDELCAGKRTQFVPTSVLRELVDVVAESEARALLTSRTLFWESQIGSAPPGVEVWPLEPFNAQQAKGYFVKAFGQSTPQREAANKLYGEMRRQAIPPERTGSVRDQFVNLPLCVRMVADFVKDGGTAVATSQDEPVLRSFLTAICEREETRQGLVTRAAAQLHSFQDMALAYEGVNPEFGTEDLALTPEGFAEDDLEKAADHALLQKADSGEDKKLMFRYEFIAPFLRAAAIAKWIQSDDQPIENLPRSLVTIAEREADGRGEVLEQLMNFLSRAHLDRVMVKGRVATAKLGVQHVSSFFFHIAQALIAQQSGLTGKERATKLLLGLPHSSQSDQTITVNGLTVRGPIYGLDLRNTTFVRCRFRDIIFRRCVAGAQTAFFSAFSRASSLSRVVDPGGGKFN